MRVTGSRAYYRPTPPKMPLGLVELIQGLTKDVLKNNPTDIYGFCAGHVQQLLEIRDGPLQNKSLPLEEKIVRAQEKVRKRAEKRRQQHGNDLLLQQRSGEGPHINATSNNDYTPSLSIQESLAVNAHKTPIHHEQDLVYSSEVEVSHNPDTGIITPSELPQLENIDEEPIKCNDDLENDMNTETAANELENKINMLEATNPASDDDLTTPDVSLNPLPKAESIYINTDMLENDNLADKIDLNLHVSMSDGQITFSGDELFKENHELDVEASAVHSMIENQICVLDGSDEALFGDSAEMEVRDITYNVSDEQKSITKTNNVIINDATEPQSNLHNLSNNTEETKPSYDTQRIQQCIDSNIIKGLTIIKNFDLTNNSVDIINGSNDDTKETKTIDISFRESPTTELQDSLINSDMFEPLPETNTDSDIVTLITQESTNDQLKKYESSNAMEPDTNTGLPQINKVNTESNMLIASHDGNHKNKQNQINTSDLIENPIVTSNENDNIRSNDVKNGHATTIHFSESPQISNQDSSNMDLETAAITIQKVFRTFLFKSRGASTFDETVNDDSIYLNDDKKEECDFAIAGSLNERRPLGLTRMDTVLQTVNEEKSLSLSTDDSSTLSSAATVIQAHVRGFLVRSKLNSNKTISTNSLAASNSNEPSLTSLEMDNDQNKNKTVLNIHIVPEGGNYLSRDESIITSMDLSLDSSPPSSINLHPLGYDKSERRKQLKREDAIQSISPPSNNSGKLSEEIDSVKELPLNDHVVTIKHKAECNNFGKDDSHESTSIVNDNVAYVEINTLETIINHEKDPVDIKDDTDNIEPNQKRKSMPKMSSDEMDVVTPFITNEANNSMDIKLMHSGEFHDAVLPTKVSRSDTSVASGE